MLGLLFAKTPLKFYIQSIWRDEAFTFLLAKQNWFHILTVTAKDSNPPLYYLLLNVWMGIFGHSEFAMRTLSFFFFIGLLYVTGLFLIDILELPVKRTMLFLSLFILNPMLHYFAFEARMYSMLALTATLSFYFLYKKDFRKYAWMSVIGLYTHYFTAFIILAQIVYLLVTGGAVRFRKHLRMYGMIGLSFAPWALFVLISRPPVADGFWIKQPTLNTLLNLPGVLFTGHEQSQWFPYKPLPLLSILLYAIGGIYLHKLFARTKYAKHSVMHVLKTLKTNHRLTLLLCWTLIPLLCVLLVTLFKPLFLPRYIIFLTVGLLFLLTYILNTFRKPAMYLFLGLLVLFSCNYAGLQVEKRVKQNVRTPLLEIRRIMNKGDVVYVTHEFNFHPAQYYIDPEKVFLYGKTYDEVPWYVGKVLIPRDRIAATLPVYPKKAFVLQDDLTYTIQALY